MARNGSGVHSRAAADYVAGTIIDETQVNSEMDDFSAEISNSIAADGQTTITANIPFNSNKITGLADGSARTDSLNISQVQDGDFIYVATVGGTADVITLTPSPAVPAHAAGLKFRFIASGANTTNVTVNPSGVGAKALTKNGTDALVAGDIPSGALIEIVYDGTQYQLLNVSYAPILNGTVDFTKLDVDNITIDGNTISSTDTNGDINITPDGTGDVVIDGLKYPQADGSAGEVLTTDGSGQISFEPPYPPGHKAGLQLTADSGDTSNDVQIEVGNCIDSADSVKMLLSSVLTKQIDVNWAVGDDAGGFPSGLTLTNGVYYHIFLIKRTDTGVVDAGFDTSTTAANLLTDASGYDAYRRIGTLLRIAGLNLLIGAVGGVVQTVSASESTMSTGTTQVPNDNTIPQNTEGDQYLSVAITPFNTSNKLIIEGLVNISTATGTNMVVSLFQDSTANALATVSMSSAGAGGDLFAVPFKHIMDAGTISETTFKVRAGPVSATTMTLNGEGGSALFGGTMASILKVTEIAG